MKKWVKRHKYHITFFVLGVIFHRIIRFAGVTFDNWYFWALYGVIIAMFIIICFGTYQDVEEYYKKQYGKTHRYFQKIVRALDATRDVSRSHMYEASEEIIKSRTDDELDAAEDAVMRYWMNKNVVDTIDSIFKIADKEKEEE